MTSTRKFEVLVQMLLETLENSEIGLAESIGRSTYW